jgi:DNA-binding HxlR family transcriptional regulator
LTPVGRAAQRFSNLKKLITGISQKMLAQQLRQLEDNGIVMRTVYDQVPPKVDYRLTEMGADALSCARRDACVGGAPRRLRARGRRRPLHEPRVL